MPMYSTAFAVPCTLPCTTICAPIWLCGFSRIGIHVHARRHAGGARLQRLGAADLAAVGCDRGVVRHVLRLERPHAHSALGVGARKSGDDQRLADVRAGALEHDRARGHGQNSKPQNSMPGCAFTPAAK